jgi:hypothetical protein
MAMLFRSPPALGVGLLRLRNRANPMRNPPHQYRPGPSPHSILPFLVALPASLSTIIARHPFAFDALVRAVLWGAWLTQGWNGVERQEGQADFGEQTRGPSRCVRWMPVQQMHIVPRRGNGKGVRGERSWTLYALRGGRGSISSLLRCAVGELSLLRRRPLPHLCGWRGRALFAGTYSCSSTGLPSSTSELQRASLRPPSFNFFGQLYSTGTPRPPWREASCDRLHGAACSDGPPSPAHHATSRSCQIPVSIHSSCARSSP